MSGVNGLSKISCDTPTRHHPKKKGEYDGGMDKLTPEEFLSSVQKAHREEDRKRMRARAKVSQYEKGLIARYEGWKEEFIGSSLVSSHTASTRHKIGKRFGKVLEKGNKTRSTGRRVASLKTRLAPKPPGWFPSNSGSLLSWGDILDIRISSRSARDMEIWYGVSDETIYNVRRKSMKYCEREFSELKFLIREMTSMLRRGNEAYRWMLELRKAGKDEG